MPAVTWEQRAEDQDAVLDSLFACWEKCKRGEHPWQSGPTYTRCTDPRACRRQRES